MALPVLRTYTELLLDQTWTGISSFVAMDDSGGITISRGRPDEAQAVQAATCTLKLNNRDGRFSPRNPTGPYYGKIGRNTPLRTRATGPRNALLLTGDTNSYATTPDTAALDITGDIDLRAEFELDSFAGSACLISKGMYTASVNAYELLIGFTAGVPHITFRWSTLGTDLNFVDHPIPEMTIGLPFAVRATLDVNNGGGGRTVTFYTAPSIAGPWTQHGSPSAAAGITSIFSSSAALQVGKDLNGVDRFTGSVRAVEVRNGIGGSAVANPDFTAQTAGTTSFADAAGRTWTLGATASIGNEPTTRFTGEVSAWPQQWNDTGADVWTQVQAAGILRRLGQGQPAAQSGPKTFITSRHFDQCWQGDITTSLSNLHTPLSLNFCAPYVHIGQGDFGAGYPTGMLIDKTNTITGNVYPATGYITGFIGAAPGGTFEAAGCVFKSDNLGTMAFYLTAYGTLGPGGYVILFDAVATTATIYKITYDPDLGYNLTLIGASIAGQQFFTDGQIHSLLWTIVDVGATLTHTLYIDGVSIATGSDALSSLQGMSKFWFTYDPSTVSGGASMALSFLTFWSDQYGDQTLPDPAVWALVADGYTGETAGRRIQRLCSENGVPLTSIGDLDATTPMGPQGEADLVTLLQDAATADLGILYEPRDAIGLTYRTRTSLYNQAAQLTLDYSAATLGSAPDLTDDDQGVHNDIAVTRPGGGSARDTLTSGALSTQAPPNGIGVYDTSATVNVATDGLLADQASWRLALGTIDEARWPALPITVMNPQIALTSLFAQVLGLDLGDLAVVTHVPAWLPPDDVQLLAQGYSETLHDYRGWDLALNCTPGSPYQIAVYGASQGDPAGARYDAENSTMAAGATTTAPSLSVASAANTQLWTTDAAAFPFDVLIGGERMTVTNITGASSPQAFTVTRSVNGVVKTHVIGEKVRLFTTPRYGL